MATWSQYSFENGITDDPIDAGDGFCHRAENLLLDSNRKLVQRPWLKPFNDQEDGTGSTPSNAKFYNLGHLPSGNNGAFFSYKGLESGEATSASALYGYPASADSHDGTFTETLISNTTPSIFYSSLVNNSPYTFNFKEAGKFLLVTNRRIMRPRKIYFYGSNINHFTVRGAGLPKPEMSVFNSSIGKYVVNTSAVYYVGFVAYPYANVLLEAVGYNLATVTTWTLYFTRHNGSKITLTSTGKNFADAMADFSSQILVTYPELKITYDTGGGVGSVAIMSTLESGLSMGAKLSSSVIPITYYQYVEIDSGDVVTASDTFKLEVMFKHEFTAVNGSESSTFIDYSEPFTYFARIPSGSGFSSIVVKNPYTTFSADPYNGDYTDSSYKTQMYVSKANLTTTYFNGEVASNLNTTITHNVTNETDLGRAEVSYTTGGILPNTQPPMCKYAHYVKESGIAYYGNYVSSSTYFSDRVVQSKAGDFDSVPADNYISIGDVVTGISSYRGVPIVFGEKSCHRIEGIYDDAGNGLATAINFSNDTGCISHDSIVEIESGLLFAGIDGIYWTNGYQAKNITPHLRNYYRELCRDNKSFFDKAIYAVYDTDRKLVWFTFPNSGKSCGLVIDLTYGLGDRAVVMGPMTVETSENSEVKFADYFGPMAYFRSGLVLVPRTRPYTMFWVTDMNENFSNSWKPGDLYWNYGSFTGSGVVDTIGVRKQWWPVQCRLKTVASSMGDPGQTKWVPSLKTFHALKYKSYDKPQALYSSNSSSYYDVYPKTISVEVTSNTNNGMKIDKLKSRYAENLATRDDYYQASDLHAQTSIVGFEQNGQINFDFKFPSRSLRSKYKQLEIASGKVTRFKSDDYISGQWKIIGGRHALYVSSSPFVTFPSSTDFLVGMVLTTSKDGYSKEYVITSHSNDTLVLSGDFSSAPAHDESVQWAVKGVPREQKWALSGFEVTYVPFEGSGSGYSRTQGNTNE